MKPGEFMVPENSAGSFAGIIGKYVEAENAEPINFSDLVKGAPDVDLPPEFAIKMIPLITQMMKEGKVTSWPQFTHEYPEEAREWERFKSAEKIKVEEAKAGITKQEVPDDISEKQALIRDPRQMNEYLNMLGEDVILKVGGDYLQGQAITAVDSENKDVDVGPAADNYLWQIRKQNPAYKDWADNYLKEEGLAFRKPPGRNAVGKYIEGLMRSEGRITGKQKPSTKTINRFASEYMVANEMTEEEFKGQAKKAIGRGEFKRYRGGYRSINNQMRRDKIPVAEIDKFLGYHFREEHSKDMDRRGKDTNYIESMTKKILKDVTPGTEEEGGGAVVQGFGTKVDRATLEAYADAKGITFEEALEEARQNPDIRLVGIE